MKKKLPIEVRPLNRDKARISVDIPFEIVDLGSALSMKSTNHVTVLHSSVSPPRRKVASAYWLLQQLEKHLSNEAAALMFLESLVTTLRSVTFALQKMGSSVEGFRAWYITKQEEMRADSQMRWLVEIRNAAEKEGLLLAEYGPHAVVRVHKEGACNAEAGEPILLIDGFKSDNLLNDLRAGLEKVSAIVEEAHARFFEGYGRKQVSYLVEYLRENPDGSWEHFDPEDMSAHHRRKTGRE